LAGSYVPIHARATGGSAPTDETRYGLRPSGRSIGPHMVTRWPSGSGTEGDRPYGSSLGV